MYAYITRSSSCIIYSKRLCSCVKGEPQILNQISTAFHSNGKTNQGIVNPQLGSFGVGHRRVGHERWTLGQRFDGAQRFRQRKDAQLETKTSQDEHHVRKKEHCHKR